MSRRVARFLFGILVCGHMLGCPRAAAELLGVDTIYSSGDPSTKIDIVFVSSGFRKEDMPLYHEYVTRAWQALASTAPFKEYVNYFNVHRVDFVTNRRDAESAWTAAPDTDVPIIVVYTTDRTAISYSLFGSHSTVFTTPWFEGAVVHEFGHALASLGDEYWGNSAGNVGSNTYSAKEPVAPNLTIETQRDRVKWTSWIESTTPIPTPSTATYSALVGLFQKGAGSNVYRPSLSCIMKNAIDLPNDRFVHTQFDPVCREALVRNMESRIPAILRVSPANRVSVRQGETVALHLVLADAPAGGASHRRDVQWLVNDIPQPGITGPDFLFDAATALPGVAWVTARVVTRSDWVRTDPLGLMNDLQTIKVTIQPPLTISGTVTAWNTGRPVQNVSAHLHAQPTPIAGDCSTSPLQQTLTDANGYFRFERVSDGRYLVCLNASSPSTGAPVARSVLVNKRGRAGINFRISSP